MEIHQHRTRASHRCNAPDRGADDLPAADLAARSGGLVKGIRHHVDELAGSGSQHRSGDPESGSRSHRGGPARRGRQMAAAAANQTASGSADDYDGAADRSVGRVDLAGLSRDVGIQRGIGLFHPRLFADLPIP